MQIGFLAEKEDPRVAVTPDTVLKLTEEGHTVLLENAAGSRAFFSDEAYAEAGASVMARAEVLAKSNVLATISPLVREEYQRMASGSVYISQLEPYHSQKHLELLSGLPLSAFSLDMIPRTTLAQAMDVLSSMASIAGYKAVLLAAQRLPKYFPMLTTAAGSIPPAKVLILGAGVAGLQAVATARRLGAMVHAFDTRLAAKEEVESLGARFVMVEGARDDKEAGGYAVEQTEEYKQRQKELVNEFSAKADVIITTAQLRGRPAPVLIPKATVEKMQPGSIIVDLAASTGGNCELTKNNEEVIHNGVTIIGNSNLAAMAPVHASQLYARNLLNFIKALFKKGATGPDFENVIVKSSCMVREGQVLYSA